MSNQQPSQNGHGGQGASAIALAELRDHFIRFGHSLVDVAALNVFSFGTPMGHSNESIARAPNPSVMSQGNPSESSVVGSTAFGTNDSPSESSNENDAELEQETDWVWPDGDIEFEIPDNQVVLTKKGTGFHFGWAFCCRRN